MHSFPKRGSSPQPSLRALDDGRHPSTCGHCGLHAAPQKALYLPLKKKYDGQGRHVVPPSLTAVLGGGNPSASRPGLFTPVESGAGTH